MDQTFHEHPTPCFDPVVAASADRTILASPVLFYLIWVSPILAGLGFDLVSRKRVYPVYVISLAVMTVAFARVFFRESEGWLRIGRALLAPFL